jgi:hypothetical protein
LPWSASTTGVASKPERANPSASEAAREPGSDALKCVPPLRENFLLFRTPAFQGLRVHKVVEHELETGMYDVALRII